MPSFTCDAEQLRAVETMLLKEIDARGRIMVRSLDRVHARTGLHYALIAEIARRIEDRTPFSATA
jgi:hypothetical protein